MPDTGADEREERGPDGLLTPWALAVDALSANGCDCDENEPGTCLACRCEAAMRAERKRAERYRWALLDIADDDCGACDSAGTAHKALEGEGVGHG